MDNGFNHEKRVKLDSRSFTIIEISPLFESLRVNIPSICKKVGNHCFSSTTSLKMTNKHYFHPNIIVRLVGSDADLKIDQSLINATLLNWCILYMHRDVANVSQSLTKASKPYVKVTDILSLIIALYYCFQVGVMCK